MAVQPTPNCMAAATAAANGKLTEQEILAAFDKMAAHKQRLEASGQMTGNAERMRRFAVEEAERAKVAAEMTGIDEAQARTLIMKAREHWFTA